MIALFLVLRPYLSRDPATSVAPAEVAFGDSLEAGRQALYAGNFRRARGLLRPAAEASGGHGKLEEQRAARRLFRQADLLAGLLPLSLEELLHLGLRINDDQEWQQLFVDDYAGRSVIFDDVVRRDARGRPELAVYTVTADRITARLALEDLTLWQRVPLEPPPRLLFGARLARLAREEGGAWVVRFQPDSGVLLTDPRVAALVCPAPLGLELQEVLRRQSEWEQR
jgi:hypothetical protein